MDVITADTIADEVVVQPVTVRRMPDDVVAVRSPSPMQNDNPVLPVGDMYPPDHFRRSADLNGFRAARRGHVLLPFNPDQFWSSDQFRGGHVITGRKASVIVGGMAPFAERANIPNPQSVSYGNIVQQTTYDMGLDPNSGW